MKKALAVLFLPIFILIAIPGTSTAQTPVKLTGKWRVKGNSTVVTMSGMITNKAAYTSGSLRVEIWATKKRYRGRGMPGYRLVQLDYPPLPASGAYGVRETVAYTHPARGYYFINVVLSEIQEAGDNPAYWAIVDYRAGTKKVRF